MDHNTIITEVRQGKTLTKGAVARLLTDWSPAPGQPAGSAYLQPGHVESFLRDSGEKGSVWLECISRAGRAVPESPTGVVGLHDGSRALLIAPPFPVAQSQLIAQWAPEPLLALLNQELTVGVVLLRLGRYSVAVYQGHQLAVSKTNARYVKGKHHAGGWSQKRFERIRQGQMRKIYEETCREVAKRFEPYAGSLDYVVLGGDRFTLDGFLKICPYLGGLNGITQARRLNVRDPKRDTLEHVGQLLWESRIWTLSLSQSSESPLL